MFRCWHLLTRRCLPIFWQVGFSIDIIDNWVLTFLTIDMFPYFPKPSVHVAPFTICGLMQVPTKIITKYLSNPLKLTAVAGIPYLLIFLIFKGWKVPSTYFKGGCHHKYKSMDYWPFSLWFFTPVSIISTIVTPYDVVLLIRRRGCLFVGSSVTLIKSSPHILSSSTSFRGRWLNSFKLNTALNSWFRIFEILKLDFKGRLANSN